MYAPSVKGVIKTLNASAREKCKQNKETQKSGSWSEKIYEGWG